MPIKRYRYTASPTGDQAAALSRLLGCVRFVHNQAVAHLRRDWSNGLRYRGATTLQRETLTLGKQAHPFLSEVSGVPLVQAIRDVDQAMRQAFDSRSGRRRGRMVGFPRFRSRKDRRQSARFSSAASAGGLRIRPMPGSRWAEVFLPKIGWLRFRDSRALPAQPTSVTVIRDADGSFSLSFVVEVPVRELPAPSAAGVGVDLGLIDLAVAVTTEGVVTRTPAPKHLRRMERKLARAQRELARRQKGSKNREKSRLTVAKLHRKVRESRLDGHHKLALHLVRENQAVAVESLNVSGLARTKLAKSVHDAGWGILLRLIAEKASESGRTVFAADRWFPSSKTCSQCGLVRKEPLSLGERSWTCAGCGARLDRDANAAVNLMVAAGLAETQNACGGEIRQPFAAALASESGTRRTDHLSDVSA